LTMPTMHGWVKGLDGEFRALMTPHSPNDTTSRDPDTMNNGISATGEIVGIYLTMGLSYTADEGGILTTFAVDDFYSTHAYGVNARGDVVGFFGTNPMGAQPVSPRGFLRTKKGNYQGYVIQGASVTQIWGINDSGDIVGQYTDGTGTHGFVYGVTDRRP